LGSNLVVWTLKKQAVISRSTTEVEYRNLANIVIELAWLKSLLNELKIVVKPPTVFCDNMSAIMLTANPVLHVRTKYLELDLYFVREEVQKKDSD